MVTKEYFCEDINFFKTKVIDGNIKIPFTGSIQKRINSTKILLSLFRKEIEWWFKLLENSDIKSFNSNNYIRKPLCIELLEYANLIKWLIKNINDDNYNIVAFINKLYTDKGRNPPLKKLDKSIRKKINKIIKTLKPFRGKVAAHRYFDKQGNFIFINDIITLMKDVDLTKINDMKNILFEYHDLIVSWIENNKNCLILSSCQNKE